MVENPQHRWLKIKLYLQMVEKWSGGSTLQNAQGRWFLSYHVHHLGLSQLHVKENLTQTGLSNLLDAGNVKLENTSSFRYYLTQSSNMSLHWGSVSLHHLALPFAKLASFAGLLRSTSALVQAQQKQEGSSCCWCPEN